MARPVTLLVTLALATVGFAVATRTEYRPATPTRTGQSVVYRQVTVPAGRPGRVAALDHSVDSATSLLRPAQPVPLTFWGRVFEIALRVLGPVLLGLAVLAIRGPSNADSAGAPVLPLSRQSRTSSRRARSPLSHEVGWGGSDPASGFWDDGSGRKSGLSAA
jgi:hypothetical protein